MFEKSKMKLPLSLLNQYENILFDFAGVLFDCPYEKFVSTAFPNKNNVEISEISKKIFQSPEWEHFDKDTMNRDELISRLSQSVGCSSNDIENTIMAMKELLLPISESVSLLYELKNKGVRLYGLTNMPKEVFEYLKEKNDFLNLFEHITVSSEVHLAKPDLEIYRYLLEFNKLDTKKTLFVDDRDCNVKAAEAIGIRSMLFTTATAFVRDLATIASQNTQSTVIDSSVNENRLTFASH